MTRIWSQLLYSFWPVHIIKLYCGYIVCPYVSSFSDCWLARDSSLYMSHCFTGLGSEIISKGLIRIRTWLLAYFYKGDLIAYNCDIFFCVYIASGSADGEVILVTVRSFTVLSSIERERNHVGERWPSAVFFFLDTPKYFFFTHHCVQIDDALTSYRLCDILVLFHFKIYIG